MSMTQPDWSSSRAQSVEVRQVLRRVAAERASWTSAVRRWARSGQTSTRTVELAQEDEEISPSIPAELWAWIDRPHPFDLPWAELDGLMAMIPSVRVDQAEAVATDDLPWEAFQEGLSLNGMKSFALEDDGEGRFATAGDQFNDAATLGVDRARQFGTRDLLWGLLTDSAVDPLAEEPEFLMSVAVPADEVDIDDLVQQGRWASVRSEPTNVERFAALMVTAWRSGIKLRFTFLTLGGGSERLLEADDTARGAQAMEGWSDWANLHKPLGTWANVTYGAFPLTDLLPKNVLRMYWSPLHLDVGVHEWAKLDPVNQALVGYALASLDLGLSFQRAAVRSIARSCAYLLVDAAEAASSGLTDAEREGFSLGAVLDGIEVFNECDIRTIIEGGHSTGTTVALADQTAQRWARGFVMAALGFVEGFRLRLGTDTALPTLYLPGLSSYSGHDLPFGLTGTSFPAVDTGSARTWTWRYAFLDELCRVITRTWGLLRGEWAPFGLHVSTPMPDLPELSTLIGGADLHWYHFSAHVLAPADGANIGTLHAGWLVTEVAAAVDLLEAYGLPGRVTVFESSASSDLDNGYQVALDKGDGDGITEQEALEFQADDVWRRLLAAIAAGAERPSHSPWSESNDYWDGCGLRRPPAVGGAAIACAARPAWFAYHRAALLLRDSGPVRLVIPDRVPARSSLVLAESSPNEPWRDAPVLAFEVPELGVERIGDYDLTELRYAYVLMVDPTADFTDAVVVEVRAPSGGLDRVQQMEPWAADPSAWILSEGGDTTLPRYDAEGSVVLTPRSFATDSSGAIELRRGEPVVVLLSPSALELTLV